MYKQVLCSNLWVFGISNNPYKRFYNGKLSDAFNKASFSFLYSFKCIFKRNSKKRRTYQRLFGFFGTVLKKCNLALWNVYETQGNWFLLINFP